MKANLPLARMTVVRTGGRTRYPLKISSSQKTADYKISLLTAYNFLNIRIFTINRMPKPYQSQTSSDALRPISPSSCKRIEDSDRAFREILLPILVQLQCSIEEVLAFEFYGKARGKDQIDVVSLKSELFTNLCQNSHQMAYVLDIYSTGFDEGSALVKTQCGTNAYIHQWLSQLGGDFISGDHNLFHRTRLAEARITNNHVNIHDRKRTKIDGKNLD